VATIQTNLRRYIEDDAFYSIERRNSFVLGTCELFMNIAGEPAAKTTEFIVVSQLVFPFCLGPPGFRTML
jgi:hypothetical protein